MTTQPKALWLADVLDTTADFQMRSRKAAAELRRLHEVNQKFPNSHVEYRGPQGGMTLRDYFAAKALLCGGPQNKPPAYDNDTRAKYAYELADAMLKAREQ